MQTCSTFTNYPLSHGQRALWFLQHLVPGNVAYNFVHAARIPVDLNVDAFRRACQHLVDRHAALRTSFPSHHGEPIQRVHTQREIFFQVEDAATWSEAQLNTRLTEELYRPFDLAQDSLIRIFVFNRAPEDHIALLAMHHIVTDLWSLALFMHELGVRYTAEVFGIPANLGPAPAPYTEHVDHQAELLSGEDGDALWTYWRQQLAGDLPILDLPTDRPRPPVQTDRGAAHTVRFSAELSQALQAIAKAHETTLYTTLMAAFQVLLHRYTGQDDILVASPEAGRSREMARTLGYFVNPVIVRSRLAGNPSFTALLAQVNETVRDAMAHSDFPFSLLVERLQPARDPSRPPLVQVAFAWQKTTNLISSQMMTSFALGEAGGGRLRLGKLHLESMSLPRRVTPFDLLLLMAEADGRLVATIEYNTDLFDAATIERMAANFQTLLTGIVADPSQRIARLPILAEDERRRLLTPPLAAAPSPRQDECIHHLVEAWVADTPDAVAVTFEATELSYQELNARANQLAHYLRKQGVGPETPVGISAESSPDVIVAVLAVLKAGAGYVPLDPAYPAERLAFMLEDAAIPVLLTHRSLLDTLPDHRAQVICLDADWPVIAAESTDNPTVTVDADNLAYVIYTSGSTGRPKGTLLHHRGLCNFIRAYAARTGITPHSRVLQFSSFSFDASVAETFMALASGATLCLARRETLLSPLALRQLLQDQRISFAIIPPAMLSALPAEDLPHLHSLMSAGEACTPEIVARWSPGRRFFNGYGPTEATVGPTIYEVQALPEGRRIPIGRPIDNIQVYLTDAHQRDAHDQLAPIGVTGEVLLGGVGLARGYLNRPDLTAERFVPNPFATEPGERLYKVGDLARYGLGGDLEFLGRVDHQVKIRGFRVELGEIEAVLARRPDVQDAVVLVREDTPGDRRIVAYLVLAADAALDSAALRQDLRRHLPDYMVPSAFVSLDALPLTPNGKVDRKALPAVERNRPRLDANFVLPQTELEQTISAIWQEVLNVEKVGVHDNFFDLGGHSLKLAKAHSEIQERLNRSFSLVEMFKYPTVRTLCDFLNQGDANQSAVEKSRQRAALQRDAINQQRQRLQRRRAAS